MKLITYLAICTLFTGSISLRERLSNTFWRADATLKPSFSQTPIISTTELIFQHDVLQFLIESKYTIDTLRFDIRKWDEKNNVFKADIKTKNKNGYLYGYLKPELDSLFIMPSDIKVINLQKESIDSMVKDSFWMGFKRKKD